MSKLHPVLRELIGKEGNKDLTGRIFDMEFTGDQPESIKRGLSVRIRLELGNSAQALLLPMGGFYKDSGGKR